MEQDRSGLDELRHNGECDLVNASVRELVQAYLSKTPGRRLLLPTIQRSIVWKNDQIVNYWDLLLRGWFPGG